MGARYLKYDDSGHCDLALVHHFVPLVDEGGKVGIYCMYCDYILFEHAGNVYVTPNAEIVEGTSPSINTY